jgi:hypothetical protein
MRRPFLDAIILCWKKSHDRGEWIVSSSSFIRWCGLAAILGATAYASLGLLVRLYLRLYSLSEPWDVSPVLGYIERMLPLLLLLGAAAAIAGLHRVQWEYYGLVSLGFPDGLRRRGSHRCGIGCGGVGGTGLRTIALVPHLGFIDSNHRPRGPRSRDHGNGGIAGVGGGVGHLGQSPLLTFRSLRLRESSCLRDVASVVGRGSLDASGICALACGGTRRAPVEPVQGELLRAPQHA